MRVFVCIFIVFFLISCTTNKEKEFIVLTTGFSSDPSTPRIGVKIQPDSIYYCEEKRNKEGGYNYFSNNLNKIIYSEIKEDILKEFHNYKHINDEVLDGTPLQLIYNFENKCDTISFYFAYLTNSQAELIGKVKSLSKVKLHKANYHPFPENLLKYKLPTPPPIPKPDKEDQESLRTYQYGLNNPILLKRPEWRLLTL
ncbi:MAG: hypothetical protein LCH91_14720 [Bacteroidetes bacterium]|nr:hypothetical protein [Bacteroidota bacterium]